MKTKKTTTCIGMAFIISVGFASSVKAQQRTCSSMENQTRLELIYPELKKNQISIEEQTQRTHTKRTLLLEVNVP